MRGPGRALRRGATVSALLALVVVGVVGPTLAAEGDTSPSSTTSERPAPEPTETTPPSPSPSPSPSPAPSPSPSPSPAPSPSPSPSPAPRPSPSPSPSPNLTEDCLAVDDGAVSFGDVDRDCDGTLLLSEQGDPISIRRSVELVPPEVTEEEAEELGIGETEDRFEPTEFVSGVLVDFDEVSEQGGTIREGSLVYTPPAGFTGEDRYTFFVRGNDDLVRQAEVLVEVAYADADAVADEESGEPSPTPVGTVTRDAADRALEQVPMSEVRERWDPPWLGWMTGIATVLVLLAVAWWLFLEVRVQDRLRRD